MLTCSPERPWGLHPRLHSDEDCPRCGWTAPGPKGDAIADALEAQAGVGDNESAMILLAVVAITGERLTRADLPEALRSVVTPLPPGYAAGCNISSIASATGLNRETTRRKVTSLIERGYLCRCERGEISFPLARQQDPATLEFLTRQLEAVVRFANDSIRDGVLKAA